MTEIPEKTNPALLSAECTGGIRMTRERVSADNKRIILNNRTVDINQLVPIKYKCGLGIFIWMLVPIIGCRRKYPCATLSNGRMPMPSRRMNAM